MSPPLSISATPTVEKAPHWMRCVKSFAFFAAPSCVGGGDGDGERRPPRPPRPPLAGALRLPRPPPSHLLPLLRGADRDRDLDFRRFGDADRERGRRRRGGDADLDLDLPIALLSLCNCTPLNPKE